MPPARGLSPALVEMLWSWDFFSRPPNEKGNVGCLGVRGWVGLKVTHGMLLEPHLVGRLLVAKFGWRRTRLAGRRVRRLVSALVLWFGKGTACLIEI